MVLAMLSRLLAPFVAQERLRDEVAALGTRVAQLERERAQLAIEHAERVSSLDALVRRLSTRVQRAEQLRLAAVEDSGEVAPDIAPERHASRSVLDARRNLRGY